jgi:hypothetical protein
MYIIPLIRTSRALTACTLIPYNPLLALSLSETSSYIIPFINNSNSSNDILFFTYYLFNDKNYALYFINKYKNKYILNYKIELFLLSIYLIYYFIQN